ncbi:hypothetical protein RclHR1_24790001 [Rhizophagus clarus]|uniref:BED-type domain-containing protein n=1 Tax=Rhizophagus clarus TaxID=94130 RepID=A0A2Z6RDS9_9GLOM|nr:hypothetical protein RclHR1_24790001 [Rhizophagus clarus]
MPPANPIWAHFNKLGHVAGFQQARAQCKYCNYEVNAAVKKCIAHFKTCPKASITALQGFFGPDFQPNTIQRNNSHLSTEQNNITTAVTRPILQSQTSINNFVDRISSAEQDECELLFAQAIYQCGLFLSLSELEPIKILFQKLRPCFKLPSRKTLSTTLLDKVYDSTKNEVNNLINSANYICLISDGWSNMMQEHWTNYLITTPRPVFFSAHQTGEIKQTGENIAADLDEVISKIDHSKLSAIITDNASSMKKAWKLLAIKYPKVVFLGCVAHSLNLLIGDIMKLPWADRTMKNGKKIVKYFKSHQVPAAILKRYQLSNYDRRISLKLPVKTRWGSSAICLNSLQVNQLAIELTITELSRNQTVRIEDDIKSIVLDDEFWEDVDNLLKVLNELVIGISMFESDTPSLSKVLDWYHNQLESPVYVFDVAGNNIKNIIEKRWERIYHPVMEVAHLLDPSFHGRHLTSDSMNKISLFIQKYYSDNAVIIWTQILNYKEKNRVFANKLAWETAGKIDPVTWWCGNFSDSAPELTQVAKKVLSIPTSSAASERNWSAFAYIHDKKRNRLNADRVLKLVYIYSNYKLQTPRETPEWKVFTNELDKNTSLNRGNIDNETQVLEESEESEDSDYEDEHLLNSSSESEEDNFNDSENDDSDVSC